MKIDLDDKDLRILDLLSEDAWLTHAEIGDEVHLSVSAIQRRVKRLRENGILTGAKASVDRAGMRNSLRLYLLLELRNDSREALDSLSTKLKKHTLVTEVSLLAGKFDVIVIVDCDCMETFTDFAMHAINENENVRHCWTLTRLKELV